MTKDDDYQNLTESSVVFERKEMRCLSEDELDIVSGGNKNAYGDIGNPHMYIDALGKTEQIW